MRVVFMGNPEFAIPTLKSLQKSRHRILAVVSNKPKRMGRGKTFKSTPVGIYAKENKIKLLEPTKLNEKVFFNARSIIHFWIPCVTNSIFIWEC